MKSRSSKSNSGYVGQNHLSDDYGIISENKNYLRTNQTQWIRPTSWLPLPSMTAGDQMFAGLLAIVPPGITAGQPGSTGPSASSNFVAFSAAGCAYTVDWGNGVTQSYSAGATAQYQFLYEGISASTTITSDIGLSGCRQTVITAYPSVAGTTFSGMNFLGIYSQAGYTFPTSTTSPWLDMRIAGSTINTFSLNGLSSRSICTLRQFEWVGNSQITNGKYMFRSASNLRSIKGTSWTANITDFDSMFNSCSSLQTVPLLDTSKGITFTSMFSSCFSLQTVPLFDTRNATTFNGMFNSCSSLQTVPLFNTASAQNMSSMFNDCRSLQTVPLFNGASATNFSFMFSGCSSLQTVPLFDTAKATSFANMFNSCSSLQTVPLFNTASGIDFSGMFQSCSSLQTVPLFDTAKATSFSNMFRSCSSLQTVPLFNAASVRNVSSMFQNCSSLQTIPLFDFRTATTISFPFTNCTNLKQAATLAPNVGSPWNISSLNLSPAALNQVFAYLPTGAAGARTCNISGNWGVVGCDITLLTAKGWTTG